MPPSFINLKEHNRNLRPPNFALRGKKKSIPTLTTPDIKPKTSEINKTSLDENKETDEKTFTQTMIRTSNKFHKEFKLDGYTKETCGKTGTCIIGQTKNQKTRTIELHPDDWAFTEADLLTSVNPKQDNTTVTVNSIPYINQKSECIRTEDLLKYYITHKGAFVFTNHKQNLKEIKGVILDVVLREINIGDKDNPETVYYSRGLLAVAREDKQLAKAVDDNLIKFGSMGSMYSSVQCSYCGAVGLRTEEKDSRCIHLKMMRGNNYKLADGTLSKIIEWWNPSSVEGHPRPIEFVEYSLLVCQDNSIGGVCKGLSPAFSGSIVRETGNIEALTTKQPIRLEVEEVFLKKPAFQKYLKNGKIKLKK